MSLRKCRACGRDFRRGRIVMLLTPDGLQGSTVCQGCFDSGVTIVAPKPAAGVATADASKAEQREQKGHLAPFIRNVEAKIRAIQLTAKDETIAADDYLTGKIEAYQGILDIMKEGRA